MAIDLRRRWIWAAAFIVTLTGSHTQAGEGGGWQPRLLHFRHAGVRSAVERTVLGAARRLQDPECRRVLEDFTDAKGVTLAARLEERRLTLARFLADLRFVDAPESARCGKRRSAAFTEPGSLVIFVCGDQFSDRAFSLQGAAGEVVIIHEVLHALGLPENGPYPTSAEISAQVRKRCVI